MRAILFSSPRLEKPQDLSHVVGHLHPLAQPSHTLESPKPFIPQGCTESCSAKWHNYQCFVFHLYPMIVFEAIL